MSDPEGNLRAAERVAFLLPEKGVPAVVIGGVALKLYAGGAGSKSDIVEMLSRNPETDLDAIRETCRRYRLRGLAAVLEELN